MVFKPGMDVKPTCWEAAFSAREPKAAGNAGARADAAASLERFRRMPIAARDEIKKKVGDLLAIGSIDEIAAIGTEAIPALVSWLEDGHMRGKAYAAIGRIMKDVGMDAEFVRLAIAMHGRERDVLLMDASRGCRSPEK